MKQVNSKFVILFLAANPIDTIPLRVTDELRDIQAPLQASTLRDSFQLESRLSIRPTDLIKALLDLKPQIVHFSGHGTISGNIYLQNHNAQTHTVNSETLASVFKEFANHIQCVVMNTCYSGKQAEAIAQYIRYVIGTNEELDDKTATAFAVGFYMGLGAGCTIEDAFHLGCNHVKLQGTERCLPILLRSNKAPITSQTETSRTNCPIMFDWVTIPKGKFLAGEHNIQKYLSSYQISRVPVTNQQYSQFIEALHHRVPIHWVSNLPSIEQLNHPVVNISYYDAMEFCRWAGVRLPCEGEWEKAARGTNGRTYPWGEELIDTNLCNYKNQKGTTPVEKCVAGASPYGCIDMAGNVWEWTSSNYLSLSYKPASKQNSVDKNIQRVIKGGSFKSVAASLKCTARMDAVSSDRADDIGFRVVAL